MERQVEKTVDLLKKHGYKRIYLSHAPNQEQLARQFAAKLRIYDLTVIVAADARPHKDYIHDDADREIINQVIASCDHVIVLNPPENSNIPTIQ